MEKEKAFASLRAILPPKYILLLIRFTLRPERSQRLEVYAPNWLGNLTLLGTKKHDIILKDKMTDLDEPCSIKKTGFSYGHMLKHEGQAFRSNDKKKWGHGHPDEVHKYF